MIEPIEQRFWQRVKKDDGCWEWTGRHSKPGYGIILAGGRGSRPLQAHRLAWTLQRGPIPDGMFICHHCDNPPCVRLDHLFLGTPKDNTHDMIRKGRATSGAVPPERQPRGETHGGSRLTEALVRTMRQQRRDGMSFRQIAKNAGVSFATTWRAVNGRTWRHVT